MIYIWTLEKQSILGTKLAEYCVISEKYWVTKVTYFHALLLDKDSKYIELC